MVAFIASPLPDETLHSLLARTMRLQGCSRSLPFIRSVLGSRARSVRPTMTSGIAESVTRMVWSGVGIPEALRRWTPLAYHRICITPEAAEALEGAMVQSHRGRVAPGLGNGRTHRHSTLVFCPECRAGDLKVTALPAWRRTHQLPGVLVCPDHHVGLLASNIGSSGTFKLDCCPLPEEVPGRAIEQPVIHPVAVAIALASRWLLDNPQPPRPADVIQKTFRELMSRKGFMRPNGTASADFSAALAEWLATTGAGTLLPSIASRGRTGMQRLWGRTQKLHSPTLTALLLMEFLGVATADFFLLCDRRSVVPSEYPSRTRARGPRRHGRPSPRDDLEAGGPPGARFANGMEDGGADRLVLSAGA